MYIVPFLFVEPDMPGWAIVLIVWIVVGLVLGMFVGRTIRVMSGDDEDR